MRDDLRRRFQCPGQFWQRNVTILPNKFFKKCAVGRELAVATWPSLGSGRNIALLTHLTKPTDARNRFVIPSLEAEELPLFASGSLTLDSRTRTFIRDHLDYAYALVETSAAAYELERAARRGDVFGTQVPRC